MQTFRLIATAAMGLEALTAEEIKQLGYKDIQVDNGKIYFTGGADAIARANLWLRTADRVKLVVGEFYAYSFEELFEKTKALPWNEFIAQTDTFPVAGRSVKSKLYSVPDCQAITKKAIVEQMKDAYHLTWFDESGPKHQIEVAIHKDLVTLTIDTSGEGLHKRGYRTLHNEAPLKETLAAAMIKLTNWHPDRPLVDLFTGSGTIPIEAALIGQNIAPGINRSFAFENWAWFDQTELTKALDEAEEKADYEQELNILGTDIEHPMIELAENNAKEAGLFGLITFKQMQAKDFRPKEDYGVIVSNPPYGERLNDQQYVEETYRELGRNLRNFPTWSVYMITSHEKFELLYGQKATKRRKLYNGNIKTTYYQYWGERPPRSSKQQ
ncbi:THUMP domain-containing class I SAM-dependent RNA methyltransferase [Salisediminibacterium halotolerans]|uniref:THUMP domain-containing class I SAM-dependent RNA methyltransferase n=1 Tax=Salisediminibacterium halotolerans TaxID=517425 RepID=UPI000EAE0064|nr:class I SAM-dependent RNA methyltransferase [Salisediminibacterium halotolerans]RLJ74077.1 putative N6-adenine-specific DNA methylase [Actinophytocola xinjiangensis]RPE87830.1 putative N6-adenine-specific DNA methylase [Salisediminibacterium halotolerans]TWG34914.1 putative N6-adenine-specific DNA methylase [Salisediminibacterium halotolerans]GEL07899.1 methyltransferase [Salisediminibacterium halotolerans]